jgi:hypothetical protein
MVDMNNWERLLIEKNRQLQNLEDDLITVKKQLDNCRYEQEALKEKRHRLMLIEAGKIIEKAGLLENYDADELYLLLVMNKQQLQKG